MLKYQVVFFPPWKLVELAEVILPWIFPGEQESQLKDPRDRSLSQEGEVLLCPAHSRAWGAIWLAESSTGGQNQEGRGPVSVSWALFRAVALKPEGELTGPEESPQTNPQS